MKLLGSMTRCSVQPSMARYSVQPRDQIFLKGYGFLSFAINVRKIISRNLSSKQSQKLHAKQSATDALKTASKRAIQKTEKATGDLIGILLIKLQEPQKLYHRIIQKQMKKKYLEKDIYLQNKDRKLLMI